MNTKKIKQWLHDYRPIKFWQTTSFCVSLILLLLYIGPRYWFHLKFQKYLKILLKILIEKWSGMSWKLFFNNQSGRVKRNLSSSHRFCPASHVVTWNANTLRGPQRAGNRRKFAQEDEKSPPPPPHGGLARLKIDEEFMRRPGIPITLLIYKNWFTSLCSSK
jgi:hypothetical protein